VEEHVTELISAYTLGILENDEVKQVTSHLRTCDECRVELAIYESLVGQLGFAAPDEEPSAGLHDRLKVRIVNAPPATQAKQGNVVQFPWQVFAAAAIFVLVIGGFLISRFLNTPNTTIVVDLEGTEDAPDAWGNVEIDTSNDSAVLTVASMPKLSENEQYQLWLISAEGDRDSGAVFSVAEDGTATINFNLPVEVGSFDMIGVTVEPAGGSPAPTGAKVLGGEV